MIRAPKTWLAVSAFGAISLSVLVNDAAAESPPTSESPSATPSGEDARKQFLATMHQTRQRRIAAQQRLDSERDERAQANAELERRVAQRVAAANALASKLKKRGSDKANTTRQAPETTGTVANAAAGDILFATAKGAAERARARVAKGVSYRRSERVAQLNEIIDSLDASQPADQRIAALNAWWAFVGHEFQSARQVAVRNEAVLVDGGARRLHANVLRLGHVVEFWVSEDGQTVGWGPLPTSDDVTWNLELGTDARAGAQSAVAVARRKEEPRLVAVPVPASPASLATQEAASVASPALNEGSPL